MDLRAYACIPEQPKAGDAIYDHIFQNEIRLAGEQPTKNWQEFLPKREQQYWIPFCTTFSRLNCAEAKAKVAGIDLNLSDRVLGVESGTAKLGNYMSTVADAFRLKGAVLENICPFTPEQITDGYNRWDEIFTLPGAVSRAKRYFGGNHSWVFGEEAMESALNYSPLQLAVPLDWNWDKQIKVVKPANIVAYHAVTIYWIDEQGSIYIEDSAGNIEFKILPPDYPLTSILSFRDLPENWKEEAVIGYVSA